MSLIKMEIKCIDDFFIHDVNRQAQRKKQKSYSCRMIHSHVTSGLHRCQLWLNALVKILVNHSCILDLKF